MKECTVTYCPIDHICIDTADMDTMIAFFQDVFGMTIIRTKKDGDTLESVWLDGGIQLLYVPNPQTGDGRYSHIAFQCKSVEAVLERAKAYNAVPVPGKGSHWFQVMDIQFEMKVR